MDDSRGRADEIHKVLLVDDEPDIRKIGALSLHGIGKWDVVVASSGRDAIQLAAAEMPDVILLDVMMPGMDGLSTLEGLRTQDVTSAIPVIFMTAKLERQELDRYSSSGVAGVIAKPFDAIGLPDAIRRILAAPHHP